MAEYCEPDFLARPCGTCSGTGCENVAHGFEWCTDCGGSGDEHEDVGPAARNIAFALACVAIHAAWNPEEQNPARPARIPGYHSLNFVEPRELLGECGLWKARRQ